MHQRVYKMGLEHLGVVICGTFDAFVGAHGPVLTGQPFRIANIRSGRKRPGLMRQHLTAVDAARRISSARVDGAAIGSSEFFFAQ